MRGNLLTEPIETNGRGREAAGKSNHQPMLTEICSAPLRFEGDCQRTRSASDDDDGRNIYQRDREGGNDSVIQRRREIR